MRSLLLIAAIGFWAWMNGYTPTRASVTNAVNAVKKALKTTERSSREYREKIEKAAKWLDV